MVTIDVEATRAAGYVLLDGVVSAQECARLADRLSEYAAGARPMPDGMRLQREPAVERGERAAAAGADVRKVSGLVHDPLFRSVITSDAIVDVMRQLMGPDLELFRADALMKPAGVGSAKGPHQDSPYWPIEPMDLWSCWIPFDAATESNGCMVVAPASHRRGALPHEHVGDDYVIPTEEVSAAELVAVPMRPGAGLFFHSLLVHQTSANTSPHPRRAATFSYMPAAASYTGDGAAPHYFTVSGGAG